MGWKASGLAVKNASTYIHFAEPGSCTSTHKLLQPRAVDEVLNGRNAAFSYYVAEN